MQHIAFQRTRKELADLERDPPPGIVCYPVDDSNIAQLEAYIKGPPDTPYENGTFKIAINVPDNYPFEPPQMRFKTKIYHPNIDENGRICADMLKTGEAGSWKPSLNLSTLLVSLRSLISSPNPDDPLDADIAREYKLDYPRFVIRAKEFTARYATGEQCTLNAEDEPPKVCEEALNDEEEETTLREYDQQEGMSQNKKSRLSLSNKKRRRVSSSMSQSSTPDNSQNASTSSVPNHTDTNHTASSSSLLSPSSSKTNVDETSSITQQQLLPSPLPIVFKTINIKPANDLISPYNNENQPSLISKVHNENVVKSPISNVDDDIVTLSSQKPTNETTKKPISPTLPKQSSSSSQNNEHHQTDTQAAHHSSQSSNHKVSSPVIVWDDAVHDNEGLDNKSIALNQTALKEISSNIANDVELVSKPTNGKRNKLSLGKSKRQRTKN